jgi:hypothetical protein
MRLRTKKDLEAYIADLEIELAYAERENLDLRAQLAEAIDVIREMSEYQIEIEYKFNDATFDMRNPGMVH